MPKDRGVVPLPVQERAAPTVTALLTAALTALESGDESTLRIDEILDTTGVSRGSLYHHFGDRDGLVDAARVVQYRRFVDADLRVLEEKLSANGTAKAWAKALRSFVNDTQDPGRAEQRLRRMEIIGAARTRPRLAEALASEQRRLSGRLEAVITAARDRGWIRPDIDPAATAAFLQAFTLGRSVADVDADGVAPDAWLALVNQVLDDVLFEQRLVSA